MRKNYNPSKFLNHFPLIATNIADLDPISRKSDILRDANSEFNFSKRIKNSI